MKRHPEPQIDKQIDRHNMSPRKTKTDSGKDSFDHQPHQNIVLSVPMASNGQKHHSQIQFHPGSTRTLAPTATAATAATAAVVVAKNKQRH